MFSLLIRSNFSSSLKPPPITSSPPSKGCAWRSWPSSSLHLLSLKCLWWEWSALAQERGESVSLGASLGCESWPYLATKMLKCLICQNLISKFPTWPIRWNCPFSKGGDRICFKLCEADSTRWSPLFWRRRHCFLIALQVQAKALPVTFLVSQIAGHLALEHSAGKESLREVKHKRHQRPPTAKGKGVGTAELQTTT